MTEGKMLKTQFLTDLLVTATAVRARNMGHPVCISTLIEHYFGADAA